MYEWHLGKGTQRFSHEFKAFAKNEEVTNSTRLWTNHFNPGVDEDDAELLKVVPEALANEESGVQS